ncbi:BBP7 family outer membrane beta-barrel protein [Alienimonas californiensis]|nr:BBP7 family outer membrane beta-barrel protein [Alienimonas californiensis]
MPAALRLPAARRPGVARRWGAAVAAATAPIALAAIAPAATADDGVVNLSSAPGFDGSPAWVEPNDGGGSGILPAGYVTPPAQFGPLSQPSAGPAQGGPGSRPAPGGMYDPSVAPAQYAPAPYCPPGQGGGFGGGGMYGGGGTDYRAVGGRPEGPGSLWTTISRYQPAKGSFLRLEYLHYNMTGEETGLVGAPVAGVTGPAVDDATARLFPFGVPVADQSRNGGNYSRQGITPGGDTFVTPVLDNNDVDDFAGVRLTLSQPIDEVGRGEFFAFSFSQETFEIDPILPLAVADNIGIGLTDGNTAFAAGLETFNTDYELEYETELWGGGGRIYFDHLARPEGFGLRPLVGVRYTMLNQNLYQRGVDIQAGVATSSEMSTTVHNNLFGTELGVEAEYRHEWCTIGVRPSVSIGLNQAQVRTRTVNVFSPQEGALRQTAYYTEISPVFDLATYIRIPLGERFRFSVGYDLLYLANVAQPNEATSYRAAGLSTGAARADLTPARNFDNVAFNGLSIGLEMLIP